MPLHFALFSVCSSTVKKILFMRVKQNMKKAIALLFCVIMATVTITGCGELQSAKPVIYLYPTHKTDISVKLNFNGNLTCTYPMYNGEWNVTANPDGHLINKADKKEYSYLYWEGVSNTKYDLSQGFVVAGKDTAAFLQKELAFLGLTPKEYNEFIVYWLPKMQNNPYNLITFQSKAYTDSSKLDITPKPDSELRVFMVYKPLKNKINLPEQTLKPFERKGFTVIEWGGSQVG